MKWAGILGAYLGWLRWSAIPSDTMVAFITAAVVLLAVRLGGRRQARLPMAPFMTVGALVAVSSTT